MGIEAPQDAVMATFHNWVSAQLAQHLIRQLSAEDIALFETIGYTIGGMMRTAASVPYRVLSRGLGDYVDVERGGNFMLNVDCRR